MPNVIKNLKGKMEQKSDHKLIEIGGIRNLLPENF